MKIFVDANVFLRFLAGDDPAQARQAEALFREAATGAVELLCGPPVLFEIAWTLRSAYGRSRVQVLDTLQSLPAIAGLRLLDREAVTEALSLARAQGTEFADAYIAAGALRNGAGLATFNVKDFKASGIKLRTWKN